MNLFHEREVEEIEEDLEEHITKRDVVEAFNYLGKQWNKALANVYQQIEQLNRRIQLSDQSLEQRFLADEATIDGLTGAVSTTFADLSAEFQALKDKVAAETGQVTAADLDGLETKLSSLGSAVGGLSQLAPPTAVTPPVDTTPPVDGAPVETAPPADPTAPVETEPTAPAPEAPVAAPASTDTGATTETGSLPGGETVTSTDAPAADGTATQ